MIKVRLTYDPYNIQTSLNIDGQNVKKIKGAYDRIKGFISRPIPLQSWIDPCEFQNWKGLLLEIISDTNEDAVEFTYRGRKIDFDDFEESMRYQAKYENNKLYDIEVTFVTDFIYDDKTMLQRVDNAYEKICSEEFKRLIDNKIKLESKDPDNVNQTGCSVLQQVYMNLEKVYRQAKDSEFRIVFSGMYTCGKSTIINAILGKALLPTSDETCTSKVFKIIHDPSVEYAKMYCTDGDIDDENFNIVVPEKEYTAKTLEDKFVQMFPKGDKNQLVPSNPENIKTVVIKTNIASLYPRNAPYDANSMKLVLIDTPGTSSGEGNMIKEGPSHIDITRGVIESDKKEMVIFATNATADADVSIQTFLDMVDKCDDESVYDQRFLFVLNRADECSFNVDESWGKKLARITDYYTSKETRKIKNPRFFPTSAKGVFKIRTGEVENDAFYESVCAKYYTYNRRQQKYVVADGKKHYHLDEVCATSQNIKNQISERIDYIHKNEQDEFVKMDKEIELHSGIVSLEMAIQDYIEKYAFPLKIQTLLKSYKTIFREVGQSLTKTLKEFNDAVDARENEELRARKEENDAKVAETVKMSLIAVTKAVLEKKQRLEEVSRDFNKSSLQAEKDIKLQMMKAIEDAERRGRKVSKKNESKAIKEQIFDIVQSAANTCYNELSVILTQSNDSVKQIEREILQFFNQVKDSVNLEDFKIEYTTDFDSINAQTLSSIKELKNITRNPEWDEGFFLFRPIRRWINGIEKYNTEYFLDHDELKRELSKLKASFDNSIQIAFAKNKNSLADAVASLVDKMTKLQNAVEIQTNQLQIMKQNISVIVADIQQKQLLEKQLREDKYTLEKIKETLSFLDIEEEE